MASIVDCSSCGRKLRVPDELLGQQVKCPTCGHTFAANGTAAAMEVPVLESAPEPASPPVPAAGAGEMIRCPRCSQSVQKGRSLCGHCGYSFDQPEGDERPWEGVNPRGVRRDCEPHRGTMILIFGILSIVLTGLGVPFGIAAWLMGSRDLKRIKVKEMDPEGEGLTRAGWICGIVGTILGGLQLLWCLLWVGFVFFFAVLGAAGQPATRTFQPVGPPPTRPRKLSLEGSPPVRWRDYLPVSVPVFGE